LRSFVDGVLGGASARSFGFFYAPGASSVTDTIGSALTARRAQLGLDKGRAASRIGMSRTTYGSYERDTQRPSIEVFPSLIEFLDVSLEDFLVLYGATCIAIARASFAEPASVSGSDASGADAGPTEAPGEHDDEDHGGDEDEEGSGDGGSRAVASSPASAPARPITQETLSKFVGSDARSTSANAEKKKGKKRKRKKRH
jgi:DNA-binding XRE family transcriptional regulator